MFEFRLLIRALDTNKDELPSPKARRCTTEIKLRFQIRFFFGMIKTRSTFITPLLNYYTWLVSTEDFKTFMGSYPECRKKGCKYRKQLQDSAFDSHIPTQPSGCTQAMVPSRAHVRIMRGRSLSLLSLACDWCWWRGIPTAGEACYPR